MIQIKVVLEGTTSMLLNRATEEALSGNGTRGNVLKAQEDPRTVAGRAVYRLPEGDGKQLAMPGGAISRMIREAGGPHKAKGNRKSLKYIVPAAVIVLDDLCGFYLRDRKTRIVDFEVDSRPVTIPATKGRVMRHRARLNEWVVAVNLRINESIMSESIVRQLVTEGSQQVGLGDFRPEKGGPFGVSSLVAWDVASEPKPKTEAQVRNGSAVSLSI